MPAPAEPSPPLPSGVRITDPAYRGSPRHALGEEHVVLKAPRHDGTRELVEELLNEVVAYRLAVRLGIPVPKTTVEAMGDGRLLLASVKYSEVGLDTIPLEARVRILNISELPGLAVFDQLIFNTDRREDHVMLTGDPRASESVRWYAIDHGHALHGPGGVVNPEVVEALAGAVAPVRIDYRAATFADLEPWLARLASLTDRETDALVEDAMATIRALTVRVDVRARLEFHAEILKAFLRRRRAMLGEVCRTWWATTGKPWELAGPMDAEAVNPAVMAGGGSEAR